MPGHLIQILLPLEDGSGDPVSRQRITQVRDELTDRFGGATAYLQAPAQGAWREDGDTELDRVVVVEVMTDTLDREWWAAYREELRRRFRQQEMVVRTVPMERL